MTARPAPVLLVIGTEPTSLDSTATRRLATAVARAAHTGGARLVSSIPSSSWADALGQAAADMHGKVVAADGGVVDQVAELAGRHRVVVVLLGGDIAAVHALLDRRARSWPVLAVCGTGGLAAQLTAGSSAAPPPQIVQGDELAQLRERQASGVAIDDHLEHRMVWELDENDVVKRILARRQSYDLTAAKLQRNGHRVGVGILVLGVVAVFLAVLNREAEPTGVVHDLFRWVLIVLPALVAALVAFDGVIASSRRWVMIRAACESIKREVFVWRARSGVYSPAAVGANAQSLSGATELLVDRVASIEAQLMGSVASASTSFVPVPDDHVAATASDDGLSQLDVDRYLALRLDDQVSYYRRKIAKLQPQRRGYQAFAILAGVTGSILATAGQTIWMPVAFAIGTALAAYAKQRQLDTTILGFSHASAALTEIRTRWDARPASRHTRGTFEQLVADVETALELEQGNWSAQMKVGLESPFPQYDDLRPEALDKLAQRPGMPDAAELDLPTSESPVSAVPSLDVAPGADPAPSGPTSGSPAADTA
jgi:hypothetical protein